MLRSTITMGHSSSRRSNISKTMPSKVHPHLLVQHRTTTHPRKRVQSRTNTLMQTSNHHPQWEPTKTTSLARCSNTRKLTRAGTRICSHHNLHNIPCLRRIHLSRLIINFFLSNSRCQSNHRLDISTGSSNSSRTRNRLRRSRSGRHLHHNSSRAIMRRRSRLRRSIRRRQSSRSLLRSR